MTTLPDPPPAPASPCPGGTLLADGNSPDPDGLSRSEGALKSGTDIVIDEGGSEPVEPPAAKFVSADTAGAKLPPPSGDVLPPYPNRPQIPITDGELPGILAAAEKVISKHVYSRAQRLVIIPQNSAGPRAIQEVAASYLATEITRHADVSKYDGRSKQPRKTNFPVDYAHALLDRRDWPNIKPLDAIVRSPFIRASGSICDQPGYDAESRCFAEFDPDEFYELPSEISREEALEALAELMAPFDEIPFANLAAYSAFIALILTGVANIAATRRPGYWITAPDAGTGKTMLFNVAGRIVFGSLPAPRPWPNSAEELRKVLFSALLAGDCLIVFDNVSSGHKVHSAELCAVLTSPTWKDRKLGESGSIELPNQAVLVFTGNNIDPVGDLARRSLVVRLNANMDRDALGKRAFKIPDLEGYVQRHRAELLMCALKIIKAHQQSEHVGPTPLPSFERWSRLVRDALIWLDMPDPCETQRQETDDGRVSLAEAFAMLAPKLEGCKFTAAEVRGLTMFDSALADAVHGSGCSDPRDALKLGFWLRENRDRYAGEFRLQLVETSGNSNRSKRYQFSRVGATVAVEIPAGNFDLVGGAK